MDKIHFFIFLLFVAFFQSCTKDEPITPNGSDLECVPGLTDFDTVWLDPPSHDFVSYTGNETIVFRNALGDEVEFVPLFGTLSHHYLNDEFELECKDGSENQYEFNREQFAVSKKCEALNLEFYLNVYTQYSYSLPVFYDYFSLSLHTPPLDHIIDTTISIKVVTSLKGNTDLPDLQMNYLESYEFTADITILQVNFKDVYFYKSASNKFLHALYYTKELGMVAFQDLDDVMWVFDRFE